jgi:uncharacterized coiled-coil protein SlyX
MTDTAKGTQHRSMIGVSTKLVNAIKSHRTDPVTYCEARDRAENMVFGGRVLHPAERQLFEQYKKAVEDINGLRERLEATDQEATKMEEEAATRSIELHARIGELEDKVSAQERTLTTQDSFVKMLTTELDTVAKQRNMLAKESSDEIERRVDSERTLRRLQDDSIIYFLKWRHRQKVLARHVRALHAEVAKGGDA